MNVHKVKILNINMRSWLKLLSSVESVSRSVASPGEDIKIYRGGHVFISD